MYKTTPEWAEISAIIDHFFQKKAGLYHYLSTAKKNYREYLKGDMVKLKKYFYVLRPILACRWILEKGTPPPMQFVELMESQLDEDLKEPVYNLLDLKMKAPEVKMIPRVDVLNSYLARSMAEVKEMIEDLPKEQAHEWEELNELFLSVLEL